MIANYPYALHTGCGCTTPFCTCYAGNCNRLREAYVWSWTEPEHRREANKKRIEAIPRRQPVAARVRCAQPRVRPSIQALSVRVR